MQIIILTYKYLQIIIKHNTHQKAESLRAVSLSMLGNTAKAQITYEQHLRYPYICAFLCK